MAENLLRVALLVAELESRGEDLSGLKLGILPLLRLISAGKLLPEAVVAFAGQPAALRRLATMPLDEQKQIVERGALPEPTRRTRCARKVQPRGGDEFDHPAFRDIASKGLERDVAEMVADLVAGHERPLGVFRKSLLLLRVRDMGKGEKYSAEGKKSRAEEALLKKAVEAALKALA